MSENKGNPQAEIAENNALKIEVNVRPIAPRNNLLGFATVTLPIPKTSTARLSSSLAGRGRLSTFP